MATKAVISTYSTGQTLYWFPLSQSLADWATYRVLATEAAAPDTGKYSATLDSANTDLSADPNGTFVLFNGAAQPSGFDVGVQTTHTIDSPSANGTRTVLVSAATGATLYWYPISRSLDDWATYRTLAVEAAAPNTGRYTATLDAVNADTSVDPFATFLLFEGASQPASFDLGYSATEVGTYTDTTTSSETSYALLRQRIGHYLFGIRTGYSEDQDNDIKDCLHDGLRRVYAAYDWSFLRPIEDVVTTAPYATGTVTIASGVVTLSGGVFPAWAADGTFKIFNNYYSIGSRDSASQITLDDTTLTVVDASSYQIARPEIPLADAFDAVANDSDLTYHPSPDYWYPPVKWRHDSMVRQMEANNPEFDRPVYYSVRTVTFDPTVGSRKVLALYPAPDQVYSLRVPMILRPVLVDEVNLYAIGGEMLSQVILEACLASAEHNFEEREHVHEKRFQELIGLAIRDDQDRSATTELGPDAPKSERWGWGTSWREGRFGRISGIGIGIGIMTIDGIMYPLQVV